jgi:hypothetical protein
VIQSDTDTDSHAEMEGLTSASSLASSACALLLSEIDANGKCCSLKRDEEFYMEDGSCIFLVGYILFKVSH